MPAVLDLGVDWWLSIWLSDLQAMLSHHALPPCPLQMVEATVLLQSSQFYE